MKQLVPAILLLFAGLACSKDSDDEDPVVTVNSPTLGQVYHNGDPIHIAGTASDNKLVNELIIRLTEAVSATIIFEVNLEPGTPSTSFDYQTPATAGTHYQLQVIAKDKMKNDARKTIDFTCN